MFKSFYFLTSFSQNSQILNEARLKVLQARQSYVNKVLEEALEQLVKTTKDEEIYKKVLQKLIEQVKRIFLKSIRIFLIILIHLN